VYYCLYNAPIQNAHTPLLLRSTARRASNFERSLVDKLIQFTRRLFIHRCKDAAMLSVCQPLVAFQGPVAPCRNNSSGKPLLTLKYRTCAWILTGVNFTRSHTTITAAFFSKLVRGRHFSWRFCSPSKKQGYPHNIAMSIPKGPLGIDPIQFSIGLFGLLVLFVLYLLLPRALRKQYFGAYPRRHAWSARSRLRRSRNYGQVRVR
jgi:hypothetical protein